MLSLKLLSILVVVSSAQEFGRKCSRNSCGFKGTCQSTASGARCQCEKGWMGNKCHRPCQDIFKSCERWKGEGRCNWSRTLRVNFFDDHCAASCDTCEIDENNFLDNPVHWMLEPLVWLVGRWETTVWDGQRFPVQFQQNNGFRTGYREILDIRVGDVPMFDRPPLNFSAVAVSLNDPEDVHKDVGFLVSFPGDWNQNPKLKRDVNHAAIELNSNTGVNTIETGAFVGESLRLKTTFIKSFPGLELLAPFGAQRTFKRISNTQLQEQVIMYTHDGAEHKFTKTFNRIHTYV